MQNSMQLIEQILNDPPRMGSKSTTSSNHPSTPVEHGCCRPQTKWTWGVTLQVLTSRARTHRGALNFIGSISNTLFEMA